MEENFSERDKNAIGVITMLIESKNKEIEELKAQIIKHNTFNDKLEMFVADMTKQIGG